MTVNVYSNGGASHVTDRLISVEEACLILGISRSTFYKLARAGEIPLVRFGRRTTRVSTEALNRLIERKQEIS